MVKEAILRKPSLVIMGKNVGAARAGLTLYLGPLYAAALAFALLVEPFQAHHLGGALVILPGIYLAAPATRTNTKKRKRGPPN